MAAHAHTESWITWPGYICWQIHIAELDMDAIEHLFKGLLWWPYLSDITFNLSSPTPKPNNQKSVSLKCL